MTDVVNKKDDAEADRFVSEKFITAAIEANDNGNALFLRLVETIFAHAAYGDENGDTHLAIELLDLALRTIDRVREDALWERERYGDDYRIQ